MGTKNKAILSTILVLALAGSAWAKKRVVVLTFDGPKADEVHDAVEAIVGDKDTLVSQNAYDRAQAKLGIKHALDRDEDLAKVAADLAVDTIVSGEVKKGTGGRSLLKLSVRAGKDGKEVEAISVPIHSPVTDDDSSAIAAKLVPVIDGAPALVETKHEAPPPPPPPPPKKEKEEPEETSGPATGGTELEAHAPDRWNAPAADLTIGVAGDSRNLSFVFSPDLTAAQKPSGYQGGFVPALFFVGELYPFAFKDRASQLGRFGIAFDVDRAFFLKSKLRTTEYPTTQMAWGVALRYRFTVGHQPTSPTFKLGVGFDQLSFTIDHGSDSIDLPNVSYSYLDVGGGVRVPIATPKFSLFANAAYLQVFSAGEIQSTSSYGGGRVNGGSFEGGFDVRPTSRYVIKLAIRYQRLAYAFNGTGQQSFARDNDPGDQDVGGALDEYFGGYLTVGWLY